MVKFGEKVEETPPFYFLYYAVHRIICSLTDEMDVNPIDYVCVTHILYL